jgi:hypothetical protein
MKRSFPARDRVDIVNPVMTCIWCPERVVVLACGRIHRDEKVFFDGFIVMKRSFPARATVNPVMAS